MARTVLFTVILDIVVAMPFPHGPLQPVPFADRGLYGIALLIVAPIAENIAMIGLIELLSGLRLPIPLAILITAAAAGALHPDSAAHIVLATIVFSVMGASYVWWKERRFAVRYLITIGQHAGLNLFALLASFAPPP